MSHIPGFALGALGSSNPQQSQSSLPTNLNLFNPQQQQAILAQHQQNQQRQQQSSPHQSQVVPGVTDPEHQRMWQAMDQHVRAHNDAAQANTAFNQMTEYPRAGGVSHPQHAQQPRLQGFSQQMHPQPQNPNSNSNPSPNPMHHGLGSNPTTVPFNLGGLPITQMTAAQLQTLAEHNPSVRAAIQQHQQQQQRLQQHQHQQQQHQQQQQQQHQHQHQQQAGMGGPSFDPAAHGLNMPGPSPNQAQHPITPANASAIANANAAELNRQFQLMSRAGQNQGQNGNAVNGGSALLVNRSQQPSQQPQQPQSSPFQQQQILNGGQMPGGNVQMGPHVGPQPHPNATPHPHLNRQNFSALPSQFPPGAAPNLTNSLVSSGHQQQPQQQPNQPNQPPPQAQMPPMRRMIDRQKLDHQIAALQTQLQAREAQLRSTGFNPATPGQITEEQRALVTEFQNKRAMFAKLMMVGQQMDKMQSVSGPAAVGGQSGGDAGMNVMQNGHGTPVNSGQNLSQTQLVHNWLQHNMQGKASAAQTQLASRPANQSQPPPQTQQPSSPFQPQQQLAQFQMAQQQQAQALQRAGSAQQHPTPAQIMQRQQQQQHGTPQQMNQPTQSQQQQALRTGQMFAVDQGQQPAGHRPPTVPPQQQQQAQQLRAQVVNGMPVLERARFEQQLKQFLAKQGVNLDPRTLVADTKEISLYDLHLEVLKKGGSSAVTQHNVWPVIGANLGFVQFPASGTEPARAGPQVAAQLAHVHKLYLSQWENLYILKLTQQERRRQAAVSASPGTLLQPTSGIPQQQQQRSHPPNGYPFLQNHGGAPQQPQQPSELQRQQQQGQQPPQAAPHLGFRQALPNAAYTQFAHMSAEDMRKHGLPEQSIQIIERHRPQLQQQLKQQQPHPRTAGAQAIGGLAMSRPPQSMPSATLALPSGQHSQSQPNVAQGQHFQISPHLGRPPQLTQSSAPTSVNQMGPLVGGLPSHPNGPFARPTLQQMNAAMQFIRLAEEDYTNKRRTFQPAQVSEHEKGLYMQQFDQLWRFVQEVEKKLIMYHALFGDEQSTTKLVTIIVTTKEQRKLLATPAAPPQYILGFQTVRSLLVELHSMMDRFYTAIATMAPPNTQTQTGPSPKAPGPGPAAMDVQPRPSVSMQPPTQQTSSAPPRPAVPLTNLQAAKPAKKTGPSAAVSTPSPAHTPAGAVHTPPAAPASSPRTPRSPPKKAAGKPKAPPKRRTSKASQQVPSEAGTSKQAGTKRPREEDPPTQGADSQQPDSGAGEPSPKRPKREEWDGPPREELEKRQQEVDGIQTNQDVQAFLARATEDFLVSGNVTADGVSDDLPKTLHDLFKGAPVFDVPESFASTESAPVPSTSSPKLSDNALDSSLLDFFDFSQCEPDEPVASNSKLNTPELVPASSTNPSPESVAETPKGDASAKPKEAVKIADDIGGSNPLSLGVWGEINGGEPAYYDHPGWKWEGDMPVLESPWAISSAGT